MVPYWKTGKELPHTLKISLEKNNELLVQFDNLDDLKKRLEEITPIMTELSDKLADWNPRPLREVKPTIAHICRFLPTGKLEFLLTAKSATDGVALTAYAFDPEGLTEMQYQQTVHIDNASPYPSGKDYREYYVNDGGKYFISLKGRKWIEEQVLPNYPKPSSGEPSSSRGSKK